MLFAVSCILSILHCRKQNRWTVAESCQKRAQRPDNSSIIPGLHSRAIYFQCTFILRTCLTLSPPSMYSNRPSASRKKNYVTVPVTPANIRSCLDSPTRRTRICLVYVVAVTHIKTYHIYVRLPAVSPPPRTTR